MSRTLVSPSLCAQLFDLAMASIRFSPEVECIQDHVVIVKSEEGEEYGIQKKVTLVHKMALSEKVTVRRVMRRRSKRLAAKSNRHLLKNASRAHVLNILKRQRRNRERYVKPAPRLMDSLYFRKLMLECETDEDMTAIEIASCEDQKLKCTQALIEEMLGAEAEYLDNREPPKDYVHSELSAIYHACNCMECWSLRHMLCRCNSNCRRCIADGCKSCDDCFGDFHSLTTSCLEKSKKLGIPLHLVVGLMKFYY